MSLRGAPAVPNDKAQESGSIRLNGDVITYASRLFGSFSLPVEDIAVIGEFTTDNGPVIDDWFLVFVCRGGDWFEASIYSDGSEGVRKGLSMALGANLDLSLAGSTDFASRVVWPTEIAGRPLFEFEIVSGTGFLRRLKLAILPEIRHSLTSEVLTAVRGGA
jgi:hypothetical protein